MATKAEIEMAKTILILVAATIRDAGANAYLDVDLQAIKDLADAQPEGEESDDNVGDQPRGGDFYSRWKQLKVSEKRKAALAKARKLCTASEDHMLGEPDCVCDEIADALQRERQAELDECIATVQRIVWGWGWEKQREKGDQLIGVLKRRREET